MPTCVCGTIGADELGHCQIHEHVFVRPTPMAERNPALCIDRYDLSLRELKHYRAAGGRSLADAQPVAAGRDAEALRRLSAESGVNIVASTGFHLLGFYEENSWVHALDEKELYRLYRSELAEGMLPWQPDASRKPEARTEVCAGMVKAAIPAEGPVGRYGVLLRAAARAAAEAKTPLMLHTEYGEHALDALRLCFDMGMRPEKLVVCHVDRQAVDFAPHERIARTGVYLDYDTVGRFKYHSDEAEVALLTHMEPYANRVLLALDTTAKRLGAYGGEIDLAYLLRVFAPTLREAGFSEARISSFTNGNCRQLFAG